MPTWIVRGGKKLNGKLKIQGAKNAVLPIMAACILGGGTTRLTNCPQLSDINASIDILRHLGCGVSCGDNEIIINSDNVSKSHIPHELMLKMRSSVMYMGAILARMGEVRLSKPGGCELGSRPIDLHLKALKTLGAEICEERGEVFCRAKHLRGAHIHLDFPSVGATENAMLAACAAEGESVISNAACEPEIVALQNFLRSKGAQISGAGSSIIRISGFKAREFTCHRIIPDRIVASTYLCAAASSGGDVFLEDAIANHFHSVITSLRSMGCDIICGNTFVRIKSSGILRAGRPVVTKPYPGFPTDSQSLMMAACLKAEGTSVFVENIFENRFRHVGEMRRLGADIRTEGRVAMVSGVKRLSGAPVNATDLRGGAALVLAGLIADGETRVYDSGHIDRGYETFDRALNLLGAEVKKY